MLAGCVLNNCALVTANGNVPVCADHPRSGPQVPNVSGTLMQASAWSTLCLLLTLPSPFKFVANIPIFFKCHQIIFSDYAAQHPEPVKQHRRSTWPSETSPF
jgi:hypothetical protein